MCGVFYRAAGEEHASGILLAAVSVGLWLASGYFLAFGWLGCILVQVGLFAALTARNIMREKKK